jgi:hypothetical protein
MLRRIVGRYDGIRKAAAPFAIPFVPQGKQGNQPPHSKNSQRISSV